MDVASPVCKHEGCKVQTDGICALGKDPVETCANYGANAEPLEQVDETDLQRLPSPVRIWASEKMSMADYSVLTRKRLLRTVALVGEQGVGKTTLLCAIYDMYRRGPFADMTFAGSETLLDFARLHSFTMFNSGRAFPTVPRTSRNDPLAFFHLALARGRREVVDLVIADRSGENYAAARTSTDLIETLEEFRLADRVCFLLDGGRLASRDDRTSYARNFRQMINALYDNGALAKAGAIELIATKVDITKNGKSADIEFLNDYQNRLVSDFAKKDLSITFHEVCALPKADRKVGFVGLDELVKRWTASNTSPNITPRPLADAPRQFDRLLAKAETAHD